MMTAHKTNNEPALALVRHYRDLSWFEAIPGERVTVRVASPEVGGRFAILENVAAHGTATPLHTHAEDEVFHILEGEVVFSLDGEISVLETGSQIVIPAGVPHAWRNRSGKPARMTTFFSPGGIETMFRKIAGLSVEEIGNIASQYGTVLVGPPIDE